MARPASAYTLTHGYFYYRDKVKWSVFVKSEFFELTTDEKAFKIAYTRFTRSKLWKEHPLNIKEPEYQKIVQAYLRRIEEDLLQGKEVKLPHNLSSLRFVKKKVDPFKLKRDFQRSKEEGKTMYHLNEHSDGFFVRLHWYKNNAKVIGKKMYNFTISKTFKEKVVEVMKTPDGHKTFMEW